MRQCTIMLCAALYFLNRSHKTLLPGTTLALRIIVDLQSLVVRVCILFVYVCKYAGMHIIAYVVVVSDRHTSSVSPYRYPESRDEQKPGPERRDCEAFVIPPKGLMQ